MPGPFWKKTKSCTESAQNLKKSFAKERKRSGNASGAPIVNENKHLFFRYYKAFFQSLF